MSADDELEARFLELGVHYETEFDVEKGLARLRAADYGLGDPKDVSARQPKRLRRAAFRARAGDLTSEAGAAPVAALEGTLLSDNLVEIDLSKIEGEPTGRALVRVNTPTRRDGLTLLLSVRLVRLWSAVLGLALVGLGLVLVVSMAHTRAGLAVQLTVVAAQFWILRIRYSVKHLRAPRTSRALARKRRIRTRTKDRRKGLR